MVMADWNLPDASGVSLLQTICAQDLKIPLVMITGRCDRESVLAVKALGISAFFTSRFKCRVSLNASKRSFLPIRLCLHRKTSTIGGPGLSAFGDTDRASHRRKAGRGFFVIKYKGFARAKGMCDKTFIYICVLFPLLKYAHFYPRGSWLM